MELIVFSEDWCEECRIQNKKLKDTPIRDGVTIKKLSADDIDLICSWDVITIPTLILMDGKTEVYRWEDLTEPRIINDKIDEYESQKSISD